MSDIGWYFRLVNELDELDTRIQALKMFIKSDKFKTLTEEESQLLKDQLHNMVGYKSSLQSRKVVAEQNIGIDQIKKQEINNAGINTCALDPEKSKDLPILKFFAYRHLPQHLQDISKPFSNLAYHLAEKLPVNAETVTALRKILEAKDCSVRAGIRWK